MEAIGIPGALSFLGFHDFNAEVKGLKDFPKEDRPPVLLTFISFRLMVGLGTLFILLAAWSWLKRKDPTHSPLMLKILPWMIPLPYIAIEAGWMVTEVGRQPWIVWGIMRTSDAVSPVATSQVAVSLVAFVVVYGLLGLAAYYLMKKFAKEGPEPAPEIALTAKEEVAHA